MEWDNLDVEVDLPDGAIYQGKIKNITEDGVLVTFENNLKPEQLVNFDNVKLPQGEETNESSYKKGDIIQVYSKTDNEDLKGWWKARIKLVKYDHYYVEFINRGGEHLVQCDQVRHLRQRESFKKLTVKVPRNLRDICEKENAHAEVIRHSDVLTVIYSYQESALIFIATDGAIHKKASLLADVHVKTLKQRLQQIQTSKATDWAIHKKASLLADAHVKTLKQKLQEKQTSTRRRYMENFIVPSCLMGLAIGRQGSNINQARKMQGISSVKTFKCDDENCFRVIGETEEVVKKARSILEFCQDTFTVPQQFAGMVIGPRGKHMDDIVAKSMVNRIRVEESKDGPLLNILGSPEAVEQAKLLLSFRLNELQNERNRRSQTQELKAMADIRENIQKKHVANEETEIIKININRQPGLNFGFSIAGGIGANPYKEDDSGIFICKVTADSYAAKAGVKVGDNLVSVNERGVVNGNHYDTKEYIKSCTKHIKLVLIREKELDSDKEEDIIPRNVNRDVGLGVCTFKHGRDIRRKGSRGRGGRGSRIRGGGGNKSRRDRGLNNISSPHHNLRSHMLDEKSVSSDWYKERRTYLNKKDMHKVAMELAQTGSKTQNSQGQKGSNIKGKESSRIRKGDRTGRYNDIILEPKEVCPLVPYDEKEMDSKGKKIANTCTTNIGKARSDEDCMSSPTDCTWTSNDILKLTTKPPKIKFEEFISHIQSEKKIISTQKLEMESKKMEEIESQCVKDKGIGGVAQSEEKENIGLKQFVSRCSKVKPTTHNATFSTPSGLNQFGVLNRYGISQQRFTENIAESDDCLLSESTGKKNTCLSLTQSECPSPACLELHLQNGVPYLWQIKIDEEWASFLQKDNFEIEKAYCSFVDNVFVKGMVINGKECAIEVNFMKHEKDMYGIIHNDADSWADVVPFAKIRRLNCPYL